MRVILDSNIIVSDGYHFRSATMQAIIDAADTLKMEILIPEVVYEEVCNSYNTRLNENLRAYDKALRSVNRLLGNPIEKPSHLAMFGHDAFIYSTNLSNRLIHPPYRMIYLPSAIDNRRAMRRALEKKKPFGERSDGYRDYLIWLTVLDELLDQLNDAPLYFISENTRDFAADPNADPRVLHPDLIADLKDLDLPEEGVIYFASLQEFRSTVIDPYFQTITQLAKQVEDQTFENSDFYDSIPEAINRWFSANKDSIEPASLGLAPGVEYIESAEVLSVEDYSFAEVRAYSATETVIDVKVTVECRLWLYADRDTPMGFELEDGDRSGRSEVSGEVTPVFEFIITSIVGPEPDYEVKQMDAILISKQVTRWWMN